MRIGNRGKVSIDRDCLALSIVSKVSVIRGCGRVWTSQRA